jgi:hypothetical protein
MAKGVIALYLAAFAFLASNACAGTLGGSAGYVGTYGPRFGGQASYDVGFFTSLPSNITFTRASGGGHFNSSCIWTVAANDQPRFDHKLTASGLLCEPRGLLIEGQRTNLLLHNRDLTNAAWTASNVTVAKVATGIDGVSNSASRLTATANNGTVLQAVTSGANNRATTAYVRRVSGSGTVEMTQNGGTNWTAVTVTSDWTRVGPASANVTNPSVGFRLGTSGDVIEVDMVQLETATFASSPIITTTASATRAADNAGISNLASIGWNLGGPGTLFAEWELMGVSGVQNTVYVGDSGTVMQYAMQRHNAGQMKFFLRGSSTQADIDVGTVTAGVIHKSAVAWENNNVNGAYDGTLGTLDTSADMTTGFTSADRMLLGRQNTNTNYLFGWLRKVVYWPVRLPDSEVRVITQ